jgi:hypothetical protein
MMALIAIAALFVPHGGAWRRDGAVLVLCMMGCAIAAFIPVAYFDGISTTRHMAGMNMATALAVPISIALVISMMHQALTRTLQRRLPLHLLARWAPVRNTARTAGWAPRFPQR